MKTEQSTLLEARVRKFVSQRRTKYLLPQLDWERFGGDTLNWHNPPLDELMNLAIPLASIICERADKRKRDFTKAEYEFLNAVEKLQVTQ